MQLGFNPSGRVLAWFSGAMIAAFLAITFSEARLKSPVYDEPPHIAAGFVYFLTHQTFRSNPQHPPLLKELSALSMMAGGVRWPKTANAEYLIHGDDPVRVWGLDWPAGNDLIRLNGPDRVLFWARLPMILIGAFFAALLFAWGRQLLGSLAAAGAVFFFVLDPSILAHAQPVTTDTGAAAFSLLALFALWNYLRRRSWTRLLLCGVCLGAALASKYSALFLLPIFGLLLLAAIRWPLVSGGEDERKPEVRRKDLCWCGSGKKYKHCHGRAGAAAPAKSGILKKIGVAAGALALMCLVAFALIQSTYFLDPDPMMYVHGAHMINADHDPNYPAYLAGGLQPHFTSYFVVAYLVKQPLAGIIAAVIGLVALIRSRTVPFLGKLFLLLPPLVFFSAVTILSDDLGIRYILPVLPFAHLLAGLGVATLLESAAKLRWAPYAAAALCGWSILAAAGVYPDHLSYFNEAACLLTQPGKIGLDGGSRCGTDWLADSNVDWGQGYKQLKAWIDRHAAGRPLKLATWAPFPAEAYGITGEHVREDDLQLEPAPGLYAVSAHFVARTPARPGASDWLRRVAPVALVGHAIYVYDIR